MKFVEKILNFNHNYLLIKELILKPYKCDGCDKNFTQKSSLTWNQLTNLSLTMYHCDARNAFREDLF